MSDLNVPTAADVLAKLEQTRATIRALDRLVRAGKGEGE